MIFNEHSKLKGKHAFLGGSNYHWLRYTPEKLIAVYDKFKAAERGTRLHDFAKECIELGMKLADIPKTINMYVNDAISYGMTPEVLLYYSDFCFGSPDAICFRGKKLRIHDLKTGGTPASMDQLMIYAAMFCLEYKVNPDKIDAELRIYQNDEVNAFIPEKGEIRAVCDIIRSMDYTLTQYCTKPKPEEEDNKKKE